MRRPTSALKRAIGKQLATPQGRSEALAWLAQSDPAAARRVREKWHADLAAATIKELQQCPDVLAYYSEHRDGVCDFVWVEETVSSRLPADHTEAEHAKVCGVVFAWLKATRGVEPPQWFKQQQGGE